jgi:hypothetical protein
MVGLRRGVRVELTRFQHGALTMTKFAASTDRARVAAMTLLPASSLSPDQPAGLEEIIGRIHGQGTHPRRVWM